MCEKVTGNKIIIDSIAETRSADLKLYITNSEKIKKLTGWKPQKNIEETIRDIANWIEENKETLKNILN